MKFVIYSHSSFADILELQEERLNELSIKYYLIIDEHYEYKGRATKVLRYKNDEPFATRIHNAVKQINEEYLLLMHEVDLVVSLDKKFLDLIAEKMITMGIDKVDLQNCPNHHAPKYENFTTIQVTEKTYIGRTSFPYDQYVYNVQPTLWKTSSLIRALENYREHTYRSIEYSGIQQFCSEQLNSYRTVSSTPLSMGYFSSIEEFVFLHLTHFYQLLPVDPHVNNMCKSGNDFYHTKVIPRLSGTDRLFRSTMY